MPAMWCATRNARCWWCAHRSKRRRARINRDVNYSRASAPLADELGDLRLAAEYGLRVNKLRTSSTRSSAIADQSVSFTARIGR